MSLVPIVNGEEIARGVNEKEREKKSGNSRVASCRRCDEPIELLKTWITVVVQYSRRREQSNKLRSTWRRRRRFRCVRDVNELVPQGGRSGVKSVSSGNTAEFIIIIFIIITIMPIRFAGVLTDVCRSLRQCCGFVMPCTTTRGSARVLTRRKSQGARRSTTVYHKISVHPPTPFRHSIKSLLFVHVNASPTLFPPLDYVRPWTDVRNTYSRVLIRPIVILITIMHQHAITIYTFGPTRRRRRLNAIRLACT